MQLGAKGMVVRSARLSGRSPGQLRAGHRARLDPTISTEEADSRTICASMASPSSHRSPAQPTGPAGPVAIRRWHWAVAGVGVVFGIHQFFWKFLGDDAYISFRYAENWARWGVPRFNPEPWPIVEGFSNPAWVALLALASKVGCPPEATAPVLTVLGSAWAMIAACGHMQLGFGAEPVARRSPVCLWPAAWLAVWPNFVVWAHGGLETSLCVASGLASGLAWSKGRVLLAVLLACLACSLRHDAVIWLSAYVMTDLALRMSGHGLKSRSLLEGGRVRRQLMVAVIVGGLWVVGGFLWRRLVFGHWLPNTWEIKAHGHLLAADWGTAYLRSWGSQPALGLLVLVLPWLRARHLPLLALATSNLAWCWYIGGDFMAYHRFALPATTAVAVLLPWLVMDAGLDCARRFNRHSRLCMGLATGVLVVVWLVSLLRTPDIWRTDRQTSWLDGRWESVTAMHRFAAIRVAAGSAMADAVAPTTLVSVGAAGAFPYSSRLPALDSYGLVAPHWVRGLKPRTGKSARPGHQLHAPLARVLADEPDLMCHIGWAARRRPGQRDLERRIGTSRARHFRWQCVSTGAIADFRAPQGQWPSQEYCCIAAKVEEGSR